MTTTSEMDGFSASPLVSWAEFFRTIWPRHTRKMVSLAGDVTLRRAKDLVEDVSRPTGDEVLLMARNAAVRARLQNILAEIDIAEKRANENRPVAAAPGHVVVSAGTKLGPHGRSARPASAATFRAR